MNMKVLNTVSWVVAVGVAASLAMVMPAFAAQTTAPQGSGAWTGRSGGTHAGMEPGVFGTVTAISVGGDANTFDVTAKTRPASGKTATSAASTTVYAVNAASAKIYKGSATTTVSVASIAVGDTGMVQGTVSGTNVSATVVRDGVNGASGRSGVAGGKGFGHGASSTSSTAAIIQGNGEPVIGGSVTVVNGTTLTVTNASNVTYTINAASTTVVKNGTSTALSNVLVGDSVIVQGTVNGNSVTASSIIDQGTKGSAANSSSSKSHGAGGFGAGIGNFFGAIGGFFQHLFGF
jgi:hypothetical protein